MQGVKRAVPRHVPQHLPGPVDARGDAADGVLAGGLGVLGADPAVELRPAGELQRRLAAEPPGDPRRQAAQRHRLLRDHVEAGPDRGGPGHRPLESLRDVIRVHVMQHAQPLIGQRERLTRSQAENRAPAGSGLPRPA